MNSTTNIPRFHHRLHLLILKRLLIFAGIMGIGTYVFLRIIFYDLPFVLGEEALIIAKILGLSAAFAVGTGFLIFITHATIYLTRYRKQLRFPWMTSVAGHHVNKSGTM